MANAVTPGIRNLNDCGCCEGLSVTTPVEIGNQPGLSAIAYRVGTHSQFKQSMLASLSSTQQPALVDLKTRSNDDLSIALLDAWAVVADILTFYQERTAKESYLRTATERRSILELARSIGYELSPGLAANTYLAFTIDDAPGAPAQTTIDAGTRVQSIPGPGEQPQTFETVAPIQARADWNALKPRLTKRHPFRDDNGNLLPTFYFDGIQTGLNLGDGLILLPPGEKKAFFCMVSVVTPQPNLQRTAVDLQQVGPTAETFSTSSALRVRHPSSFLLAAGVGARFIPALPKRNGDDGLGGDLNPGADGDPSDTTKRHFHGSTNSNDLNAAAAAEDFDVSAVFTNALATQPPPAGVLVFRTRAAIFGHNAPPFKALPDNLVKPPEKDHPDTAGLYYGRDNPDTWADATLDAYLGYWQGQKKVPHKSLIFLDTSYPNIVQGSYIVLLDGSTGRLELHRITATSDLSWSDLTFNTEITLLELSMVSKVDDLTKFGIRTTTVFGQSEIIRLAHLPITDTVPNVPSGTTLDLEGLIVELKNGQGLLLCGEPDNNRGNIACEYITIKSIEYQTDGFTRLTLDGVGLQNTYVRNTVTISGNVAPATQGETRQEVLGSGDGSQPNQSFTLSQSPLTYTSSGTASGTQSSLKVYVNDVQWHEVPAFYGREPTEHIYITRTSDDGKTSVQFGDGNTGSRLPSGQNNVRATYRTGIGLAGVLKVDQLTTLLTRPPGVRGVTNPQVPTGAADPEGRDEARQNAPLKVLTLDRIVSLRDYQDFARAFAGVAKALATWTWDGQRRGVFVTVAGPKGAAIEDGGSIQTSLLAAMRQAGDPFIPLQVHTYLKRFFRVAATVKINPDYLPDKVAAAIEAEMHSHFSFDARSFGQQVTLSEVTAVMQNVTGAVAVEVTALYRSYPPGQDVAVNFVLAASIPQAGSGVDVSAAELLTLDPGPLALTITT